MKSKAPLPLMEQIVMLLVFSLAAAVCVQAFVLADRVSRRNAAIDQAALRAETVAETYKSCGGDAVLAAEKLGGHTESGVLVTGWNADWQPAGSSGIAAYLVTVTPSDSGSPLLGKATVSASASGGETLFSIEIAWQEAKGSA